MPFAFRMNCSFLPFREIRNWPRITEFALKLRITSQCLSQSESSNFSRFQIMYQILLSTSLICKISKVFEPANMLSYFADDKICKVLLTFDGFGYRHKHLVDRVQSQGYETKRLREILWQISRSHQEVSEVGERSC